MRGHLRKRGEGWELRVFTGRDPASGRKRYVTRTFRGARRQAESALAAFVVAFERGEVVKSPFAATAGSLLEAWFELNTGRWSPKTLAETRRFIDRDIGPELGSIALAKLRTAEVDRFYGRLRRRGLAPGSVRRIHVVLHAALNQAVRWQWMAVNPATAATLPRVPKPVISPPEPEQVVALLELSRRDDPDLHTFVRLAVTTGARRGELCALRWSDVELDDGSVTISRSLVHGSGGLVERTAAKTDGSTRRIALDAGTVAVLRAHRVRQEEVAVACEAALVSDPHLFTETVDASRPWRPDYATSAFMRLRDRAGLKGVRLHDLRHAVATRLIRAGVDVRTVAGRLGHANAATTLRVYSHFVPAADRAAADLLGRMFESTAEADPVGEDL